MDWEEITKWFADFAAGGGLALIKALAFLVVGLIVTRLIVSFVRSITIKNQNLDNSASTFITSLTKVFLYLVVAVIVLSVAGIDTASLIAAFAAVSLAISLGLQNTLSGLTNGIVIIFTKPFKQGDYVNIGGTEGSVKEIRLFNTKLTTPDNLDIIIPNSVVLGANLTNYSSMPLRRVDVDLPIPYGTEVSDVKQCVLSYLKSDKRIVKVPEPMCRLKSYGDSALIYTVRAWTKGYLFWDVKFDLLENLYTMLRKQGIEIPFNQLDVHLVSDEPNKDGENKGEEDK